MVVVLVGVVYSISMNTTMALWGKWLRKRIGVLGLRIERLGQRLSAWAKVKKQQRAEKAEANLPVIQLSDEAAERLERLADEAEEGKNMSPRFTSLEDAFAYLDEETRKYREGGGSKWSTVLVGWVKFYTGVA